MPKCKSCFLDLPTTSFYSAKNTKSGLQGTCKTCFISRNTEYNKVNRLDVNKRHREWASRHKDTEKIRVATWQKANKTKRAASKRLWRLRNPSTFGQTLPRKAASHYLRPLVFARDSFQCVLCRSNQHLQVHHILPFSIAPQYLIHQENAVTLCKNCHLHAAHSGRWSELNIELASNLLLKVFRNTPIHVV